MERLDSDKPNPDASLSVQFYSKIVKNEFASNLAGQDVTDNVDYIKISIPGDTLNSPDRPINADDKNRFPAQWHAYKSRSGINSVEFKGTPLTKWPRLQEQQIRELEAMKFTSIEAIALASDAHVMGIGMIAGQSAFTFRDEAKAFLAKLDAESKLSAADLKVQAMQAELAAKEAALVAKMEAMQEQMTAMAAIVNAQQQQVEAPRRGRPARVTEDA